MKYASLIFWNFLVLAGLSGESDGTLSGCDFSACLIDGQILAKVEPSKKAIEDYESMFH